MRTLSVHDTLRHIEKPHCLFCGRGVATRNDLVAHIGNCRIYSDYRDDLNATKLERNDWAGRHDKVVADLRAANATITDLKAQIKTLEENAAKKSVKKPPAGEP